MQSPRERFTRWWQQRLPRTERCELTQRNIYILPTRAGLAFGITLTVMLLASINYQLNLGYVLTFLLTGAGLASIHLTHATLRGLTLHLRPSLPGFAGEPALLEVVLESPGRPRHGISLCCETPMLRGHEVWVDVPAQGQSIARLAFVPQRRGLCPVPLLRIETRFPFGLFRAWTVWRPAAQVLAWPKPERPAVPLPPAHALVGEAVMQRTSDGGELEGVRAYRRGDALRRVVWKKAAKTGELVSRETSVPVSQELWLDWPSTAGADAEARLSRLAAWVLLAEQAGALHGLRLPGVELAPGQGDSHRRRALEALALWH